MREKMITFIFDDSYENEYTHLLNLFGKYDVSACTAVTSDFIGKTKDTGEPYCDDKQLHIMQAIGWEILSHGKTHRDLALLSETEIREELKGSKDALTKLGFKVESLVYPMHSSNDLVRNIAKEYYRSARGRYGLNNPITDLYNIGGILIDDHRKIQEYINLINSNTDWLIFYCHLCKSKIITNTIQDRLNTIETLLQAIKDKSSVVTMREALNDLTRTS